MTIYRELTCSHYDGLVAENERLRTVYDAAVAYIEWEQSCYDQAIDPDGSEYDNEWIARQQRLEDAVNFARTGAKV